MTADLYPRPSREQIAARNGLTAAPKAPGPLRCFATHLNARMRALGWDQDELEKRAAISDRIAARAINGTAVDLGLAGRIAALVGLDLAVMTGPYKCGTCDGKPPAGFGCLECGTEGERK